MPRLSNYVLRQLVGPVALFTFLLTAVVWLSQSLRLLDLIINRGQSAPTFLYLTLLLLPTLLVIILPIAFFGGALYGLNKLNADSELVAMSAAGYSRWQLAKPVLAAALIAMAFCYLCSVYLMPLGQRVMKDKMLDIRADIGAAILSVGTFNTPADGLTVFIRDLSPDGQISGILVHDNRVKSRPVTYLAQNGILAQTPAGARLIMLNGTIEESSKDGAHLSALKFERYVFDLDQFASHNGEGRREAAERYLPELFWPKFTRDPDPKIRNIFLAEGNDRLAEPLYCLTFAMIALAAITRGRRARGAYALRLTMSALLAGTLRIMGYGARGVGATHPAFDAVLYLIPLLGAAAAIFYISDYRPWWLTAGRPSLRAEPAP